jgi:Immunoglobulin I-set domain
VDIDDTTLESETVASLEDAHVRWLVKYTSHPVATATWLDPKRKPITASPKYLISNKINETSLTILNITFEDAGNYSLILNNGRSDARRPFRLIIEGDLVKIHDSIIL